MANKVGLAIAIYTINYGTFLQAYATQYTIKKLGYDTEIININSVKEDVSKNRQKYFISQIFNFSEVWSYRYAISSIISKKTNFKYRKYIERREKRFLDFKNIFFDIGEVKDSWGGLTKYCENFSSVVVGSDQLWRPANIAGNFYTLNFVPDNINKISYATSFGMNKIRTNQVKKAKKFLSRINYLSCREKSGVDIINDLIGRKAEVVCDPTILLNKNEWDQMLNQTPIINGDYILVYLLGDDKNHRMYMKKLAKFTGCKIVGVLHGSGYIHGDEKYMDIIPNDIGPLEFLNLIKYSKYICTDSFHGCVFSILFEKNFYAFKLFSDKNSMSTNGRVINLLTKFNLQDRLIDNYSILITNEIDYSKVNVVVDEFRKESLNYLSVALKG